jgi:dTMP kinase
VATDGVTAAASPPADAELPTEQLAHALGEPPRSIRLFGSPSFFRLWLAQCASSLGDWIGLVAILALAARVGKSSPEAAVGIVMSARMIPGFFLASVGGVLVDALDRRRVIVFCDIGRGLVLATLPFVDTVAGLFFASLLLEILTLLWTPAKEASVPNLVRPEQLTTANSLSLVAAYGTFPIGSAAVALLAKVAEWLGGYGGLSALRINQESLAIYLDVLTFFVSALLISTLALPRREKHERGRIDLSRTFTDLKDGWRFIGTNPVVRSVMIGIGCGLVGGGMVVPLGPTFSERVLHGGPAGFGLLLTALGTGVAVGVGGLSAVQKRLPRPQIFTLSVLIAGVCMLAGASMSSLTPAMVFVAGMGVCAGSVYVVGFTILQETVSDELRGRIFATLYTLVRLCLLLSMAVAPLLAGVLTKASDRWFDGRVSLFGVDVALPGTRLTLWLGGLIIVGAGMLAVVALRQRRSPSAVHDRVLA